MTSNSQVRECFDFVMPLIRQCGEVLKGVEHIKAQTKSNIWDQVTVYDKQIEEILMNAIKKEYPGHKFISEEDSDSNGISELTDEPTWIIDPIDGTSNFIMQLKLFAISVALVINKQQTFGIVYCPILDECYTAIKGEGAYRNGERISTSGLTKIEESQFNYEISLARVPKWYTTYMYRLKHVIKVVRGMRSLGCPTMGLCYVADGKTDAYQCDGLYPWDAAAGVLIVREAGGFVCDSSGKDFDLMNPNFFACATKTLADQYMELERKADEERMNTTDIQF